MPKKVIEWAVRKKGVPEVLVWAIKSMYDGTRACVKVGNDLSEEFLVTGVYYVTITILNSV